MPDVKKAILRKKIGNTIFDLMVKTQADMVQVDSSTTLAQKLVGIDTDIAANSTAIGVLNGNDTTTGSVAKSVKDAIDALKTNTIGSIPEGATATTVTGYIGEVKTELDGKIAGGFHFKGTKRYIADLPATGQSEGDVWQVLYKGNYKFTGEVDYVADLPASAVANDVKLVKYAGESGTEELNALYVYDGTNWAAGGDAVVKTNEAEYAWNGTAWVELGSFVDLSNYDTRAEVNTKISTALGNYASTVGEYTNIDTMTKYVDAKVATQAAADAAAFGKFYLSATEPAGLTENDLWAQEIVETNG